MTTIKTIKILIIAFNVAVFYSNQLEAQSSPALDARVEAFLKKHKGGWHDLNVPYEDGKILHDIIVSHKYTSALEIGQHVAQQIPPLKTSCAFTFAHS